MRVLDLDMDYFLYTVPYNISASSTERADPSYLPWKEVEVRDFLENHLKLDKKKKVKGKIVTHHQEAIEYWDKLISDGELITPFEVVHVDSHADLGLWYTSWVFIFEKLLGLDVSSRSKIQKYPEIFDSYDLPGMGDYLLFAIAFRWINSLIYICNPSERGDDYYPHIIKGRGLIGDIIQLPYNPKQKATTLNTSYQYEVDQYLENSVLEPEVPFRVINQIEDVYEIGNFNFVSFSISPNYTPKSADFIIDIINEYIENA